MMKICLITVAFLVFVSGSVASQNESQSIHNGISNSTDAGYEITVLATNISNACKPEATTAAKRVL